MKKTILSLLLAVGLIGSASAQILFSDDFSNASYKESDWTFFTSQSLVDYQCYPSSIKQNNGSFILTDGAAISPNVILNSPYTISGSWGSFLNAGCSLYITLRSDRLFNSDCWSRPSGVEIALGGSLSIALLGDNGPGTSLFYQNTPAVLFGEINTFSINDDGNNVSLIVNELPYANIPTSFNTGSSAVLSTDYRYYGQPTDAQITLQSVLITIPEPSTYALFGIGAIGLLMVMRRKKAA